MFDFFLFSKAHRVGFMVQRHITTKEIQGTWDLDSKAALHWADMT